MKQTIIAAVLLLACLAPPASAQDRVHLQQAAELRIVQEQQAQLALSIAQLAQSIADSNKALYTRLDQMNERVTKLFADQSLVLGPIGDNARIMRERSQDTSTRIGELTEELRALRRDVAALRTLPVFTAPPVDPLDPNAPPGLSPSTTLTNSGQAPVPSPVGLSPERLFNSATADYASGQWDLAIEGFQTFVKNFADDPRADDAQQGIGDALYSANKFEEAIAAYNVVIQRYPKGDQLAYAYYKRATVQRRAGRLDDARASYEAAIKVGDERASILAKQGLDSLARAPGAGAPTQKP